MKYGLLVLIFHYNLDFRSAVVWICACKACSTVYRWSFRLELKSTSDLFERSISVSLSDVFSFVVKVFSCRVLL